MGDEKSPLALLRPTASLAEGYLLQHTHHILNRHLTGIDPNIHRVQGLLIKTNIGEVAVEMRRHREAKSQARKVEEEKGVPDLLGTNMTYLLHLGQVYGYEALLPFYKELTGVPNLHHLKTMQRALDDTAYCLSVRAPIVTTPGLIKLTLSLGFYLEHR